MEQGIIPSEGSVAVTIKKLDSESEDVLAGTIKGTFSTDSDDDALFKWTPNVSSLNSFSAKFFGLSLNAPIIRVDFYWDNTMIADSFIVPWDKFDWTELERRKEKEILWQPVSSD